MATQKQIEANRRNALLSTGPNTPLGKAISRLNALRHGRRATKLVLLGESRQELQSDLRQFGIGLAAAMQPPAPSRAGRTLAVETPRRDIVWVPAGLPAVSSGIIHGLAVETHARARERTEDIVEEAAGVETQLRFFDRYHYRRHLQRAA